LEEVTGAYTKWEWVSGPQFELNKVMENIGPLPAGSEEECIFKVYTNPNYENKTSDPDIWNGIIIEGDGPDAGVEPDPEPEASAEEKDISIDIIFGKINMIKTVEVIDKNGTTWGPDSEVWLPENVVYPIDITWQVTFINKSEEPVVPERAYGHDKFLEDIGLLGLSYPPGSGRPPWLIGDPPNYLMLIDKPYQYSFTQKVASAQEMETLDKYDDTQVLDEVVTNMASFGDINNDPFEFTHADVCGEELLYKEVIARIHLSTPELVPTLSEWGLIVLAGVLGALLVLRMRR
jgi:hypothetical protein